VNVELPAAPDPGVSAHAGLPPPDAAGGFRAPTLRNVDKRKGKGFTKAYGHNGYFKSLESIVHFYNTSRVKVRCDGPYTEKEALAADCWPEPEWPATLATDRLVGNIGMDASQEAAVVAYLETLTDMVTPKAPPPYKTAKKGKGK
jgi:cytochrome c peroxidase